MNEHNSEFRCPFTGKDLFEIWLQQKGKTYKTKYQHVLNFVLEQLDLGNLSKKPLKIIQKSVFSFCSQVTRRWQNSKRFRNRFLEKNFNWLNRPFQLIRSMEETANYDRNSEYPLLELSIHDIKRELDLKKPDISAEIESQMVLPDSIICRLCLMVIDKDFTLLYNNPSSKSLFLQNDKRIEDIKFMIKTCMRTFDLALSENPVVCDHCLSQLITAYNFFSRCLSNQDRLQIYKETHAVSEKKMNLPNILLEASTNLNHSPQVNGTMISSKREKYFDESVNCHKKFLMQTNEEFQLKSLEIDIKEESYEVYNFVDCNSSDVKQEINVFDGYESQRSQSLELFSATNNELKSEINKRETDVFNGCESCHNQNLEQCCATNNELGEINRYLVKGCDKVDNSLN